MNVIRNGQSRILVVDDEPSNRKILKRILEPHYLFEMAETGAEALDKVASFRPEMILLDVMLPDIDGYEICRRVRAQENHQRTKIIMLTGRAIIGERMEGYAAGADDYIVKPYNEGELLAKIRVFLSLRSEQEINAQIRTFLALMDHGIRNVVNSVYAAGQLLARDSQLREENLSLAQCVLDGSENILRIFERLKTFLKLQNGYALAFRWMDLASELRDRLGDLEPLAGRKGVTLLAEIPQQAEAEYDGILLPSLLDIVENALHHTPAGKTVRLKLEQIGGFTVFEVLDEGCGISRSHRDALATPFFGLNLMHHQGSFGVSVALASRIAELHGGRLLLQGGQGAGTTFSLTIPDSQEAPHERAA